VKALISVHIDSCLLFPRRASARVLNIECMRALQESKMLRVIRILSIDFRQFGDFKRLWSEVGREFTFDRAGLFQPRLIVPN